MLSVPEKTLLGLVIVLALAVAANKPTFRTELENVESEEGTRLKLLCQAEGDTPISYAWYNQYEDEISEDSSLRVYVSNNTRQFYDYNETAASVLNFRSLRENDEGLYTCTATNDHGSSSKIYQLTVLPENDTTDDQPALRRVIITNITSTSVTFALDIVGSVTTIAVKYSESRDNRKTYDLSWSYGDDYEVKGLIPGGLYSFQFNVNGTWSSDHKVTLLPDKPEIIFRQLGDGQIKIEWLRKFDDIMRRTVDRYELSYYTVRREGVGGDTWIPNDCAITIQIPTCSYNFYMISGLSQNTYYEIQLRAHTASGFGESYRQKIFLSSYG